MAKKFLVSIDLNKNELQNGVIQNLGTAPSSPVEGQIYYDTGDDTLYFWNGTQWQGAGGDVENITAGDGIAVSGTTDFTISVDYDDVTIGLTGNSLQIKNGGVSNAKLANSSLTITAGAGLTGGGSTSLGSSTTLNIGAGTGITINADDVALDTTSTRNTDHDSVSISAGNGLTGGGTIASSRTINVGSGTGISVGADTVGLDYIGTDNFIDAATNLEGTAISTSDTIIYHDASDNNVKKGLVSDLPFSTSSGTVTSVNATGSGGVTVSGVPITTSGTIAIGLSAVPNASLANSSVTITAGAGLISGGSVSLGSSTTLNVGAGTGITINANDVALDTTNDRNVDHTAVSITAGDGLSGGGDISSTRTLNVGAGTGIDVAADSVAVSGASTLTPNNVPKWNGSGFTNSSITDDGTTVTITNNLDVQGTITYIDSTTVEFGDNILLLAKDQTSPSLNAGWEVERGSSPNVSFLWVEASQYFSTIDQAFHIGSIAAAGAGYSGNSYLVSDSGVVKGLTSAQLADDVATGFTFTEGNAIDITGSGSSSVTIAAETSSTTNEGVVELATTTETRALSDTSRAVTPSSLTGLRHSQSSPATGGVSDIITHNLNSKNVIVQVYEIASGATIECDVVRNTTTQVTLSFATAQTQDSLQVLIIKVA
jgi:hypothetical protein